MEDGIFDWVFAILDWRFIIVIALGIALRFWFKGAQIKDRITAKQKVAIVTGANCGIGKQIVRQLNLKGAKVYLLCRDIVRAQKGLVELVQCGCNPERLIVVEVDLCKFSSIRRAAKDILADEVKIDILVNNAGVMFYPKFKLTEDGHETTWQTNYLGHFLLTELLMPALQLSSSARIVDVSDATFRRSDPIDLEMIDRREGFDPRQAYSKSKLAMLMHAHELTKRLRGSEASHVTINACHPGHCHTRLFRYTPLAKPPLNYLTGPFKWFMLKTPKDGAQTPLYVALSNKVNGLSGQFFSECKLDEPLRKENLDAECEILYNYSKEVCGLIDY